MAKINVAKKADPIYTHEGAKAVKISPKFQLERALMACMLWEDTFYEDGLSIADRLTSLVNKVNIDDVVNAAIRAREDMKIRHAPLFIARLLAKRISELKDPKYGDVVENLIERVIQRADELSEFIALYWKDGKQPLSAQVKRGLAKAFNKFDAYQIAKYNRNSDVTLRDVMFLVHPVPKDYEHTSIFKNLADNTLEAPDTWEVSLSAGKNKKETFTRLLSENKLGAMALLRNLRNMIQSGVDENLIKQAILKMRTDRVLPFRFITAARYAPKFEPELEKAMFKCIKDHEKMPGKTVLLIDVSGSMHYRINNKTDVNRIDVASGLAVLLREICENVEIFSFSYNAKPVPARRGFALKDAIMNQPSGCTYTGKAIDYINRNCKYDRIIVITDEQSHDFIAAPKGKGYVINVGSYKHGIGYGVWDHIDGWSEAVIDYIQKYEDFLREIK